MRRNKMTAVAAASAALTAAGLSVALSGPASASAGLGGPPDTIPVSASVNWSKATVYEPGSVTLKIGLSGCVRGVMVRVVDGTTNTTDETVFGYGHGTTARFRLSFTSSSQVGTTTANYVYVIPCGEYLWELASQSFFLGQIQSTDVVAATSLGHGHHRR